MSDIFEHLESNDFDEWLDERTEMFTYFKHPMLKVEATELLSVENAFEDEVKKKNLIEYLKNDLREVG